MDRLDFQNPVFTTYVIAATLMVLKGVGMSWLTVARMMQVKGGFRSPEDIRRTRLNPDPNPLQLAPDERVERVRRIQLNDLESVPYFLVVGLLFVIVDPPLLAARLLLYGFVIARLLHFAAYLSAMTHDMRAFIWTISSLILIVLTCWTLIVAVLR